MEFNRCFTIFSFVDRLINKRRLCIRIFGSSEVVNSERLKLRKCILIWTTMYNNNIMTCTLHGNYCECNYLGNAGANCRCHWDNAAIFVNVNKVWKSCWRSFWLDPCPLPFPPLSSRHSTFGRSKGTMSYNQFNKTVYVSQIKKLIYSVHATQLSTCMTFWFSTFSDKFPIAAMAAKRTERSEWTTKCCNLKRHPASRKES